MTTERITDDLDRLVSLLPSEVQSSLVSPQSRDQLLEVVLERIIEGIKKIDDNIDSVDVSIKKLSPPIGGNVDSVELRKKV